MTGEKLVERYRMFQKVETLIEACMVLVEINTIMINNANILFFNLEIF